MDPVVHLHLHTRFSLLDGLGHEKAYADKAKSDGQPAIAITDHGAMFGIFQFVRACIDKGIQPIIGCELYVAPGSRFETGKDRDREGADRGSATHLTVLAKNEQGYKNLLKLTSLGYTEGFYYKPRVDKELLAQYSDGLITTSGCPMSEISRHILKGELDQAERLACWYRDIFGEGNYYLEIQDHGLAMERTIREGILQLHRRTGIPLLATNDAHYVNREDADAHDVLLCIQTQSNYNDPNRMRMSDDNGRLLAAWHMLTAKEMRTLFKDYPDAVDNTVRVAEQIKFMPVIRGYHPDFRYLLPEYPLPEGETAASWLRHLTMEGAKRRYGGQIPHDRIEQINKELAIINEAGFDNYFLIVQDIVAWARDQGIPVGHGRGSGVGSEVAYCLRITNIPPKDYDLVFERFLHLHRISMPDFDIDIADDRRDEVVDYIRRRYGEHAVAQIATFGTLAARAAVRQVAKVLSVSLDKADQIATSIPTMIEGKNLLKEHEAEFQRRGIEIPRKNMSIDAALIINPALKKLYDEDPEARRVLDIARTIEGVPSHASRHAGGFCITPGELSAYAPVFVSKGVTTLQFDLVDTEDAGLLKMDLLGLRTLRVVADALRLIRENFHVTVDLEQIPLDDQATFELLQRGDTDGVFQFESDGMKNVMRQMLPTTMEDLIAAVSLFRPGPMQFIETYCNRKHGREEVQYLHPDLEPILKTTYGVMVYQEQVLQIARTIAGFDLGKGDMLRRAIGKKKMDEMQQLRKEFVDGAVARGYDEGMANELYEQIVKFADYAFNKAHAAPYARLAYETAYLKAHYPSAFFAALLTSEMGNHDKLGRYIAQARQYGLRVLPPDVNASYANFRVMDEKTIIYGLQAVRNVGTVAKQIEEELKNHGPFQSVTDLCLRVSGLNKRVLEALIRSGALRALGDRASILAAYEDINAQARQVRQASGNGQLMLDDLPEFAAELRQDRLPSVEPDPVEIQLHEEREYLGAYVSSSPLSLYRDFLEVAHDYDALLRSEDNSQVIVGGFISELREHITTKGNLMAFATLAVDDQHLIEMIIWPETYQRVKDKLDANRFILAVGRLERREIVREYADDEGEHTEGTEVILKLFPDHIRVIPPTYTMRVKAYVSLLDDVVAIPNAAQHYLRSMFSRNAQGNIPVFLRRNGKTDRIGWANEEQARKLKEHLESIAEVRLDS